MQIRGRGEPARADVVPGSVEVEQSVAEILLRARSKATVSVGLVLQGETGFHRVNQALPMWVIQVLREVRTGGPLDRALPDHFAVPVRIDAGTRAIRSIDRDLLAAELAPLQQLAADAWRHQQGLGAPVRAAAAAPRALLDGIRALRGELGAAVADIVTPPPPPATPRPDDQSHPPIEGVGYDTWIRVNVALGQGEISAEDRVAAFERAGFPPGRVDEVDAAWWERARTDDAVRDWYGHDYRDQGG